MLDAQTFKWSKTLIACKALCLRPSPIRESANLSYAMHNLFIRGCQRDTDIIFCHRTKGAAGCSGNIAFAQQIQSELSPSTPCTIWAGNINQDVECSMRRVKVATEIF